MSSLGKDFRTCANAKRTRNLAEDYFCSPKRLHLREADLTTGVCPCKYWLQRRQRVEPASKTVDVSLFGERK